MNLEEIKDLIKLVSKSGIGKIEIENEGFKIAIENGASFSEQPVYVQAAAPVALPQVAAPAAAIPVTTTESSDEARYITVKSPMIGTFYRTPGPDKDAFVSVGSVIQAGDKLCIIEAMKTFNEIESEVSGKIVKILVDDMSPVEYDQPLFLVDPS